MRIIGLLLTLFAFALPANAGWLAGTDERGEKLEAQLEGNNSYHAHLARELAAIASEEKSQHDLEAAHEFIKMAEDHAAQAGGSE
jgi:hypothetical protein